MAKTSVISHVLLKKKANHETLLVQEPVTEVFNPFFNKSYDHLKKGFVIWVTVRPLVSSPQSNYPKRTQNYHALVSNMLS